jgi:hypothetical protein
MRAARVDELCQTSVASIRHRARAIRVLGTHASILLAA